MPPVRHALSGFGQGCPTRRWPRRLAYVGRASATGRPATAGLAVTPPFITYGSWTASVWTCREAADARRGDGALARRLTVRPAGSLADAPSSGSERRASRQGAPPRPVAPHGCQADALLRWHDRSRGLRAAQVRPALPLSDFQQTWAAEVARTPALSDACRVLLLVLALHHMTAAGEVSVPRKRLAEELGRSERRIAERFEQAVAAGFLTRKRRGQQHVTAVYRACLPLSQRDGLQHPGIPARCRSA